jgi:hypothetical protein
VLVSVKHICESARSEMTELNRADYECAFIMQALARASIAVAVITLTRVTAIL